ncbi:hypothetical protein BGW36DRAFT_360619 [Talaromyces proteolyticus]|uniref:F-box domain-containing protein n=1 Tax=Talaromyces proteolyticus TaxID=1131652 RepID=A0AAD4KQK8_9EURO|nr:uncharacterized protein BGW36DRAFT_360619 [Talaromyces proteolyticus]KAH8694896.1 hypothetical protein BGW36DRAFT_360619 [Talaromyces proteolyticus]
MPKRVKLLDGSPSESASSLSILTDSDAEEVSSSCDSFYSVSSFESDTTNGWCLGLPFEIWTRIFHYAGIVCNCPVDLIAVNHRPAGSSAAKRRSDGSHSNKASRIDTVTCALQRHELFSNICQHSSFLPMLAVSSQARHVTQKAIFFQSPICLKLRTREDLMGFKQTLRGFERMPPLESYLNTVHVKLQAYDGRKLKGQDKRKSILNLFEDFSSFVGSHLLGTIKDFGFECRVGDFDVARELVNRMGDNYRELETCGLRFESSGSLTLRKDLVRLAVQTATKSTASEERETKPFRFMDLPNEIKEMILKEALIARYDPCAGEHQPNRGMVSLRRNGCERVAECSTACCEECSPHLIGDCFCAHKSAYSTSCTCFMSPMPLFLTSNFMYQVASHIFYTQNTFFMKGGQPYIMDDLLTNGTPRRILWRIRRLHIDLDYLWPQENTNRWARVADSIRRNCDLTRLELDIYCSTVNDIFCPGLCDMVFAEFEGIRGKRTRVL